MSSDNDVNKVNKNMSEEQTDPADEQNLEHSEPPPDTPEEKSFTEDEEFVKEHSFSGTRVVLITLGIILFIGFIIAGIGGYYVYSQLQPVDPESEEEFAIEIPMGSSTAQIASILEEQGLIHDERIFYYYVRLKGATDFQAGEYQLSPSMELDQIIEHLQEGILHENTTRFTIPEGYTVEEIAERLEEEGLVEEEEFLRVINEGDFSDISFVSQIPADVQGRDYRLEGFLFPETYEVYADMGEEEIIRKMLQQFEVEFSEEWQARLAERDLTLYEAVTMASIIEREAAVDEEREVISGVIHNRLAEGMLLEIDATVQFALGEHVERVLNEHLQIDHPYNTYKYENLPPGPIAVPSLSSISAALNPEEHNYKYYVTKKDGSGEHYFAETYEEHVENDNLSRENEKENEES